MDQKQAPRVAMEDSTCWSNIVRENPSPSKATPWQKSVCVHKSAIKYFYMKIKFSLMKFHMHLILLDTIFLGNTRIF